MYKTKTLGALLALMLCVALFAGCTQPAAAPTEAPAATDAPAKTDAPAETEAPAEDDTAELKDLPTLTYKYNTGAGHQLIAESLQAMLSETLGMDITIENSEWAVFQTARTEGNFQIARHGWLGDYSDPMTFLDMWTSNSGQNDTRFRSPEFDALIKQAKESSDPKTRMDAMHQAETLLMETYGIIPIYYYTNVWLDNGKVTGYVHDNLLGNMMFMWAQKDDGTPINYGIGATPKSLDPQLNNATDGANIIQSTFEGLTRKNSNNQVEPGVASSWDISEDGLTWTFHLRPEAKWSDGVPVTAKDFVYAWQRAVDPATGSEYSYQLWYIENGEAISEGEMTPDQLGVTALDDNTLEVKLAGPCAYFTELVAFPTTYPVREDIVSANDGWANDPSTYICNGPYKLTQYTPNDRILMSKNDTYWDSANYPCPDLVYLLTDDDAAMYSAFRSGEIDITESFPPEETQAMKNEGVFNVAPIVGTYFLCVNIENNDEALMDVNVRKAIALAINRVELIEMLENEAIPAYAFVPGDIRDFDGSDFRQNGGNFFGSGDYATDVAEAKELLRAAGYNVPE